jgi:hypothetical protein
VHSAPASTPTTRCASCGERDYTGETALCQFDVSELGYRIVCLAPICRRCRKASEYGYCAEHEAAARAVSEAEGD